MAHPIKNDDALLRILLSEYSRREDMKVIKRGGKYVVEIDYETPANKFLHISAIAWSKMWTLVHEFDTEVGWHGIARKERGEYYIDDIMVYPQRVTGVTVETDLDKYSEFLMSFDDEIFENIRFQGHSHVNMPVHPSQVDMRFYREIISQMDDGMFYIFMIVNKQGDMNIWIHDKEDNSNYETDDIMVIPPYGMEFLDEAYRLVSDK